MEILPLVKVAKIGMPPEPPPYFFSQPCGTLQLNCRFAGLKSTYSSGS